MTSWHFNFNLTFSHLTISEGQRNCMITRMQGDATHAASSEQHPNFSHNFPHGQTQRRESASKVGDWSLLPSANISLCDFRKGAILFTVKWSGWDSSHSWLWKDRVKRLQRYRHPDVQIDAALSRQYVHLLDIFEVIIHSRWAAFPPPAPASVIVQLVQGCGMKGVDVQQVAWLPSVCFSEYTSAGILFFTCLTAFDKTVCFPVHPGCCFRAYPLQEPPTPSVTKTHTVFL